MAAVHPGALATGALQKEEEEEEHIALHILYRNIHLFYIVSTSHMFFYEVLYINVQEGISFSKVFK
jgi:hypothetical protein